MKHINKLKLLILFSIFALLLPTMPVKANMNTDPIIGISTVYEERRTNVDLNVFIHSDEKIGSGSFDIEYNQDALSNVKAEIGTILDGDLTSLNTNNDGTISVAWAGTSEKSMDGTLLTFTARISNAGEHVPLQLNNVSLYREDGSKIDAKALHGAVKPFTGTTQVHNDRVPNDKVWTITVNKPYHPATLNNHVVTVKRGSTTVNIDVQQKDSHSFTVTPKESYRRGNHVLEISEQLRSENGNKLNESIRHEFRVQ